jgi:hypothetical protein
VRRRRLLALGAAGVLVASTCTAAGAAGADGRRPAVATAVAPSVRIELPPLGRIEGPKPEVRPSFTPPVRTQAPVARKAAVKPKPVVKPRSKPTRSVKKKPVEAVTRIGGYVFCGSAVAAAQRCIDAGKLTLYYPAGVKTLAGHNYMGWSWMDDLPVGRKVVITSGGLAGTYWVYGHGWAKRGSQGGTFPSAGLGASVALQTCTSTGTGFSFLRRA